MPGEGTVLALNTESVPPGTVVFNLELDTPATMPSTLSISCFAWTERGLAEQRVGVLVRLGGLHAPRRVALSWRAVLCKQGSTTKGCVACAR